MIIFLFLLYRTGDSVFGPHRDDAVFAYFNCISLSLPLSQAHAMLYIPDSSGNGDSNSISVGSFCQAPGDDRALRRLMAISPL